MTPEKFPRTRGDRPKRVGLIQQSSPIKLRPPKPKNRPQETNPRGLSVRNQDPHITLSSLTKGPAIRVLHRFSLVPLPRRSHPPLPLLQLTLFTSPLNLLTLYPIGNHSTPFNQNKSQRNPGKGHSAEVRSNPQRFLCPFLAQHLISQNQ